MTFNIQLGIGRHLAHLSDPEERTRGILKYDTFFQLSDVICTLVTKISISIYILRIKNDRVLRYALWVLMILMTLASITCIVGVSVACIPLDALWDPKQNGICFPLQRIYNVAYIQSAFTIITDLALSLSPIYILWNVRIKKGKKVLICFLMSLGLIATISNALRNVYQGELTANDFTCP